jgi:RNA-directed DNA polymerase
MGRVVESFNPNERLLERILSKENLETAWKRVRANHGAPGVDGISIEQFPDHTKPLWAGIRESLLAGTYHPSPVRRVEIPKPTGGTRPLGIPTVLDRLIQQAIAQVLSPIFDPWILGIKLRIPTWTVSPSCGLPGPGVYSQRLSHRRRYGPVEVL